jgi:hypothetical protein
MKGGTWGRGDVEKLRRDVEWEVLKASIPKRAGRVIRTTTSPRPQHPNGSDAGSEEDIMSDIVLSNKAQKLMTLSKAEGFDSLGVLSSQCLDRRIPDKQLLIEEVTAWEHDRNGAR